MKNGVCSHCLQERQIYAQGRCRSCLYPIGPCQKCSRTLKLVAKNFCVYCAADHQCRNGLLKLEAIASLTMNELALSLFQHYVTHLKRSHVQHGHFRQAKHLVQVLTNHPPSSPLQSWEQIRDLSQQYGPYSYKTGCPWRRIGKMLHEQGVLPSAQKADTAYSNYQKGTCEGCRKALKLIRKSFCASCAERQGTQKKLLELEAKFPLIPSYLNQLFLLYLTHLRRSHMKYHHIRQAEVLSQILILSPPLSVITSWVQLQELSQKHGPYLYTVGCPWRRIGKMLQEQGDLPSPEKAEISYSHYIQGYCQHCGKTLKLGGKAICFSCLQDRNVRGKLQQLEPTLMPEIGYSKYLFELYLTYLKRSQLKYYHLPQAQHVSQVLTEFPPSTFTSWAQIQKMSETYGPYSCASGCPWRKIGRMLQELGVLPPPAETQEKSIENALARFEPKTRAILSLFIKDLRKIQRNPRTLRYYLEMLLRLNHWLRRQNPVVDLLQVNSFLLKNYFDEYQKLRLNSKSTLKQLNPFRRFYRWCLQEKKILFNPCDGIHMSRPLFELEICSPEQINQLQSFVKRPDCPSEAAFLICLVLFFGLGTNDLTYAQVESNPQGALQIHLRRTPRTLRRRFYYREPTLKLPQEPQWFFNLQKRFFLDWQSHYLKTKKTYPRQSLVLPLNGDSNRPLKPQSVTHRFKMAAQLATGLPLHPSLVRRTCGHLYSSSSDGSILSRMGWSPSRAILYARVSRVYSKATPSDLN